VVREHGRDADARRGGSRPRCSSLSVAPRTRASTASWSSPAGSSSIDTHRLKPTPTRASRLGSAARGPAESHREMVGVRCRSACDAFPGPERMVSGPRIARRIATGIARGGGTRGRVRSSCRSRRSVRAATSRRSCSPGSDRSRRWSRSSSRRMSAASPPAGSISSSSRSGCASQSPRSAASLRCSVSRCRRFVSGRRRAARPRT
jgi:hypothetical protein